MAIPSAEASWGTPAGGRRGLGLAFGMREGHQRGKCLAVKMIGPSVDVDRDGDARAGGMVSGTNEPSLIWVPVTPEPLTWSPVLPFGCSWEPANGRLALATDLHG